MAKCRSIPAQSELYARSCHGEAGKAEILLEVLSAERVIHSYPHCALSQPRALWQELSGEFTVIQPSSEGAISLWCHSSSPELPVSWQGERSDCKQQ